MSTIHSWFRSGAYSLLGHTDLPPAECGQLGVLIVPPFGWENVCSYRPLRFMGRTFAANGIPALRFDLPGTGDSSGGARDCGLFNAWIQSVGDAAGELRKTTGVADVAVVGIRLGAMLAVMAAARGSNLQDLVLWGARATGRALLRELRTFFSMERGEYANGVVSLPESVPGLEMGGFLISPEMQRSLEALDLSSLPGMQRRRLLVLSCDDLPPDAKLVRALESSGCPIQVKAGSGYADMMALPHETLPPAATSQVILEFFKEGREERQAQTGARAAKRHAAQPAAAAMEDVAMGVVETIYTVETPSASIFGILSEPAPEAPRADCCLLFLNAGAVRHIGPNRMWVEAARRWAAKGVASLRLDLEGIGESDGEQNLDTAGLYQDQLVEQVEIAMDSLRFRAGSRRFAAIGLCSGAFWAFHAAIRNPQVRGAILLNQRLFFWDPEVDRRRLLRRTAKGLIHWSDWRRLARGEVPVEMIKEIGRGMLDRLRARAAGRHLQIPPGAMADAWSAIERNQSRLTLVFADDEPLLREMQEEGQLPPEPPSGVRCVRIGNSGHTFRPLWAQATVHDLIDRELDRILCESEPDSTMGPFAEAGSEALSKSPVLTRK